VREAAWGVEERVLWRGGDTARAASERAAAGAEPLQRLIQTKLTWPVADAWRDGGTAMRTGLATAAVAAVAATSAGGAVLATGSEPAPAQAQAQVASEAAPPVTVGSSSSTLQGVTPDFAAAPVAAPEATAPKAAAAPGKKAALPPVAVPAPGAPPGEVATAFAQAFVRYEVGKVDASTTATFAAVAQKPLADSLSQDPPRLPAGKEVPEAAVMNVVLSEPEGKQLEASVSLTRLEAASELRLTLEDTREGWQVTGVRG
jgi:hypothetical protein